MLAVIPRPAKAAGEPVRPALIQESALRKISMSDRLFACATEAHERSSPGSCGGLFSEEFPSGARGCLSPLSTLRTLLPNLGESTWRLSRLGRPQRPPEAPLPYFQLLEISTGFSRLQLAATFCCHISLRLPENSSGSRIAQPARLWKAPDSVGKGP